jgi:hypothetical protein
MPTAVCISDFDLDPAVPTSSAQARLQSLQELTK